MSSSIGTVKVLFSDVGAATNAACPQQQQHVCVSLCWLSSSTLSFCVVRLSHLSFLLTAATIQRMAPTGPAALGAGSRGGSELTGANGDAQDTAHTRGSTPGPSSQGGGSELGIIGPSHNRRSTSSSVKPKSKDEAAQMVSKLGSQRINNIFTHLRKICQHPLLVRHHFTDEKVSGVLYQRLVLWRCSKLHVCKAGVAAVAFLLCGTSCLLALGVYA